MSGKPWFTFTALFTLGIGIGFLFQDEWKNRSKEFLAICLWFLASVFVHEPTALCQEGPPKGPFDMHYFQGAGSDVLLELGDEAAVTPVLNLIEDKKNAGLAVGALELHLQTYFDIDSERLEKDAAYRKKVQGIWADWWRKHKARAKVFPLRIVQIDRERRC